MAYTKTVWKNGQEPALNEDNLNNIEQGIYDITNAAVRYDTAQSLTAAQQTQARGNIGAANIDTQNKVLATTTPSRTVTVAAADLPAYIAALPRMLTENLTIDVGAGTCVDALKINGFYGCGTLIIRGASDYGSVFTGGLEVDKSHTNIRLRGLSVSGLIGNATVSVLTSAYLYLENCAVDCTGASHGVSLYDAANCSFNQCTIQNCVSGKVLLCGYGSIGTLTDCAMTNNNLGAWVYHGGMVLLAGSTPDTLGGSANAKGGGIIAKADGTLL